MLVVTGATGFVGRQLVPMLASGRNVIAVSRDPATHLPAMPGVSQCDYNELAKQDLRGATFLHLAVRNNDHPGTHFEFYSTNVDFLLSIAALAKNGGARRFINLCSTHALETKAGDLYGESKREGARALQEFWPHGAVNLYVPAIYGSRFQGRLAFLNQLPSALHPAGLAALRLVKPMLAIERLRLAVEAAEARPLDPADPWSSAMHCADPVPERGLAAFLRRTLDLAAAFAVIIFAGWAMVLISAYVRSDSRGPAIFAQQRVGRNGRVFTCYKFRTMAVGTAHVATHTVSGSAVTRAGEKLRRTKLDELPQIINLFRNEMTLVGPRPCLPMQEELIAQRAARGVLDLKPGITGVAQIHDVDMSNPSRLASWDDRYRAFRTLFGDAVILLKTVMGRGRGDRVVGESS